MFGNFGASEHLIFVQKLWIISLQKRLGSFLDNFIAISSEIIDRLLSCKIELFCFPGTLFNILHRFRNWNAHLAIKEFIISTVFFFRQIYFTVAEIDMIRARMNVFKAY